MQGIFARCSRNMWFWEKHQSSFPILSVVGKVYLGMSALVPVECMFSTTGIISNGKRSSIGPAKLNRILCIHDNFAIVTSDNLQGRWHWRCVCLLSEDGFFARKPALKRLASAVRRVRPTGRSSYSRRESFERRLSCKRTSCRPDPTSEHVCFFARKSSLWIGALICKNTKAALLRTCSVTH